MGRGGAATRMTGNDADQGRDPRGRSMVERYWSERSASVPLAEGYLADPIAYGVRDPALRTIDEVAGHRAAALLGESGLGKTIALRDYEETLRARPGMSLWFDLATYGSDGLLAADVFGDRRVEQWRDGTGELHLLLDSFDQAKARIPNLGALLASQLRRCPTDRLRLEGSAEPDRWIEEGIYSRSVLAGYKAAALLTRKAPERLDGLPASVWARWAPVMAYYPVLGEYDDAEVKTRLLRQAYRQAPQVVLATIDKLLIKASVGADLRWAERDQVAALWDGPLERALLGLLDGGTLSDDIAGEILDLLVEKASPHGRRLAVELLADDAGHVMSGRAVRAAASLLRHERLRAWPTIWQHIEHDPAFGQGLVLHLAARDDRSWFAALDADAMADFYIWLTGQFPPEEDPNVMEAHFVTDRERVGLWREELLRELISMGTAAGIAGVRRIAEAFLARPWLGQAVLEAEEVARRSAWSPLPLDALLAFLADPSKRVVRSADDLAELVVESLGRLQHQLQGDLAQAWALWNEAARDPDGKPKNRPKDETRLSGYVAVFLRADLEDRGLVVNREVQVVQRTPKGLGERLDVHVEAFQRDEAGEQFAILKVPIEVKGCWNEGLFTAMHAQLYGQYMVPLGASQGIYLVGWFDPRDWDADDPLRGRAGRLAPSVRDVERRLEEQRAELASVEGVTVHPVVLDVSLTKEHSS
jgi:hypothetical protein